MSRSDLVSPKQVARAIGVSESSLKRWCDQGLIQTLRTAGGHRKMPMAEVLRFVRDQGHVLVSPEVLGLPAASPRAELGLTRARPQFVEALLAGNEPLARQIVFDLYLARHPLSVIFDDVIAAAFHDIGDRWACHEIDVYEERRSCELTSRLLFDLRKLLPEPERAWTAAGGTIEGDQYSLPSIMAELVLRECGYRTTSLGKSIPLPSLIRAAVELRPQLFWLSVSHIPAGEEFVSGFTALSRACQEIGTALIVGGRALTEGVRQQVTYSAYCDTMQHLESFARTLLRTRRPIEPGISTVSPGGPPQP